MFIFANSYGKCVTDLDEMKKLGGWSGRSLTHGDYQNMPLSDVGAIGCSYAYRNAAFNFSRVWDTLGYSAYPAYINGYNSTGPQPVWNVRLNHITPPFKTQKILGNMSLIADRSEKACRMDASVPECGGRMYPGDGLYGHQDGYNVLYGDWHGAWNGDPQQKMIWFEDTVQYAGVVWFGVYYVGKGPTWFNGFDVSAGAAPYIKMTYEH
jgi:hypothetical protein